MHFISKIKVLFYNNLLTFSGTTNYGKRNGQWLTHSDAKNYSRSDFILGDVSYYYSSVPDFILSVSFPSIGPKKGDGYPLPTNNIPAHIRYNSEEYTYLPDPIDLPSGYMTSSGMILNAECWGGSHTLTGNVNLADGVKLYILTDAIINLNSYYVKCNDSSEIIRYINTTFNPSEIAIKTNSNLKGMYSTFSQAWSNVVSGQDVYLEADSYSGNVYMKSGVGLYGKGPSSTTISGRVYFNYTDGACLSDLKVTNLMRVYDCWAEIDNVYSEYSSSSYGLHVHNTSDLELSWGKITQKGEAVIVTSSSYVSAYRDWFCQNTWDISADLTSYADAIQCTFSSYWPGSTVQGLVYYTSWNYCGVGKCAASQETSEIDDKVKDPAEEAFKEILTDYNSVKQSIKNDRDAGLEFRLSQYSDDLRTVVTDFKEFVLNYPESGYALNALGRMGVIWNLMGDSEGIMDFSESVALHARSIHFKPYVMHLQISQLVRKGEYEDAIKLAGQLIAEYPNHPLVVEWMFSKGMIYKYFMNEVAKSEDMFRLVVDLFSDHPVALSALDELGELIEEPIPSEPNDQMEAEESLELACENYPNPSNPETTIYFTLPEHGHVVLKVFNIMGREVTTLVDEDKDAGRFSVQWTGRDSVGKAVSTGMYFYKLQFEQRILTGKISLIQ